MEKKNETKTSIPNYFLWKKIVGYGIKDQSTFFENCGLYYTKQNRIECIYCSNGPIIIYSLEEQKLWTTSSTQILPQNLLSLTILKNYRA